MKIIFKNFLGTVQSFFRNDATVVRNYQLQDRDGIIADDTDLAAEVSARNTAIANAIAALIDSSPSTLNTLEEIATALGDDPNLAATLTTAIGLKANASAITNVNNTSDANKPVSTAQQTALDLKANIASVIGLQDLYMGAVAMWPRVTGGCAALAKTELATSLANIQSLDFDQTTQEFAQFTLSLPRNWNNGTITAKFYWTAAAGAGDVQWGISGGAYSNDDALTVALGSAITVDDTLITANDLHITSATAAITLAGTPADADFLVFQISRNPASDTLSADAKLLGVVITLTTDSGIAA